MEKEIRTLHEKVEVRSNEEGKKVIVGYAAKFNVLSNGMWGFKEKLDRHAFDNVLDDDVRALFNHDPNYVLGRTKNGTLKLTVDDIGLRYEIIPPDTTWANDLIKSMERGDINQSSFAFTLDYNDPDAEEWEYDEDNDIYIRTIKKIKRLYDVSPVTYPAYEQTESVIAQRSLEKAKEKYKKQDVNKISILKENYN
ncbi:HK97 family phage prohead protease [Caloramator sp. Dgby_cultured_2]|uniref:HK97 family phage prohead protease n=1 Tax=Caloramator sp. Dgby_cultured_2 TaxID=3029174 RepID=UPI00237DEEE7|nr:HK97 family phage prohead protease [Caloramator sp. Dgby_cultured_2]WDU84215.1 HK97 family phage prohead protease [Caloramator sp. Dgby_cultured_2]